MHWYLNMYVFFENGCRGGITSINHRYARANNKYLATFDPTKPTEYITYIDKNSLYPESMMDALPLKNFKWEEDMGLFTVKFITELKKNAQRGYHFEVTLRYPHQLHDEHNDYPLAAESVKISKEQLSPFSAAALSSSGVKYTKTAKLTPNLGEL